jgi:hypothetical protein
MYIAIDICLYGRFDGPHYDLDLAVLSRRQIPKCPNIIGAGIGLWGGIYEYSPWIVFFADDEVRRLHLIVSVGYGIGYLAARSCGLGAVLDIFLFQGLEAYDLITDLYIIDKSGRLGNCRVFIERDIEIRLLANFRG